MPRFSTGDLKCENVIIDEAWTPLLGDFGLSVSVEKLLRIDRRTAASVLGVGRALRNAGGGLQAGSLRYLAPEALRAGTVEGRAEVFEGGAVSLQAIDTVRRTRPKGAPSRATRQSHYLVTHPATRPKPFSVSRTLLCPLSTHSGAFCTR